MTRIAIVGMACRYPDASSPKELWENVVAGRRAFRRIPDVRTPLADYHHPDPEHPDTFYAKNAAVIEGYEFDRAGHRVAGSTYRSTDLTHWLALDVAGQALADAGFTEAEGLPKERTAVVVGNTLTGEFTRANLMRLRWPYVRRTVAAALGEKGWEDGDIGSFLDELEVSYKAPFPDIDEDTLAGGLANTIAGRICNHFDLKGGGYTVDGACSSSLLSVANGCKALVEGDVDVALAGGVDLSIDPFEIIGFAKTGALAKKDMRIYDKGSNGFWPGEGCGMVVLMRQDEAEERGLRIYASVAGWGISSDGKGGITRPEKQGHRLAISRAYERAGFPMGSVPMFEGHGTGTAVGDETELRAISEARHESDPDAAPAAISSVKGMIGHTKAAAGIAGFIKATMALSRQVLPPTVGCFDPHPVLGEDESSLRTLRSAEEWPEGAAVRAGISAMGFGGINTHIVLENVAPRRRVSFDARTKAYAGAIQDAELLLLDGGTADELRETVGELLGWVPQLSYAQIGDLADRLQQRLRDLSFRAALVVTSPEDATKRLQELADALDEGTESLVSDDHRVFLRTAAARPRIGFLFPGQGSGKGTSGGSLRRRFAEAAAVYDAADLPTDGDMVATETAQPRIVTGSTAGVRALSALGLEAEVAVGHSLGEISALQWAGAIDEPTLLRIAGTRGATMAEHSSSGSMAGVSAGPDAVEPLLEGTDAVIAGYNGPEQTVVAGTEADLKAVEARASEAKVGFTRISVSHAFHSPLVAPAADAFGDKLADETFAPLERTIVSTVTGEALAPDTDLPALLRRQITDPVLFTQAVAKAAQDVDLFVEVGPGAVLSGLASRSTDVPAVALDTDDETSLGLLTVVAAAYTAGVDDVHSGLFHGRLFRPLTIGQEFSFFASPVESAPLTDVQGGRGDGVAAADQNGHGGNGVATGDASGSSGTGNGASGGSGESGDTSIDVLRRLAAARAELPVEMVDDDSHLLDDLHLSSITVGQVMKQTAEELGVSTASAPTNFATATVGELAEALDSLIETGDTEAAGTELAAGAEAWARPFRVDLDEVPLTRQVAEQETGSWEVVAPDGHPLAGTLAEALTERELGGGTLVLLPEHAEREHLTAALGSAQTAATAEKDSRFVLVQHGRGAAGMAKTLRLEAPQLRVTIVHTDFGDDAVDRVASEVGATTRFAEVFYDEDGTRRVPTLRAMPVEAGEERLPIGEGDVLLVTGGGKGITMESALVLATRSGCNLGILGRSDPAENEELSGNLERMREAGVEIAYARADVTDADAIRAAVEEITSSLGQVTAVLHGAGRNEPAPITQLDADELERTLRPKVGGLEAVLDAVDGDALKLLVAFGSIIGRSGLKGEAHYATANEWLANLTDTFKAEHPDCHVLCLEWSVWSGVGMGERLSVVEQLAREGVTAVTPDQGLSILQRLVADPQAPSVVVISGRTEGIDTVRHDLPDLPLLRFVDKPLIRYHGVELVTEVELDAGGDLYLADHLLDGNLLLPAVFGMEAMAQVAFAATGWESTPVIEDAEFLRPIVVPPTGRTTIRIAVTVTGNGTVAAAIRSDETEFAADHFKATLRYDAGDAPDGAPDEVEDDAPYVRLEPETDLYGDVLFQGKRFQRLLGYRWAAARNIDADVARKDAQDWFAAYLPPDLLLGDPGMRDALMHGNQVCIPHATLLPQGVDRIYPLGDKGADADKLRFTAVERSQDGDSYVYDVAVRTEDGTVVERWEGLKLRAVRHLDGRGPWHTPLVGPYVERELGTRLGLPAGTVRLAVEPHLPETGDGGDRRREITSCTVRRANGGRTEVSYRQDGRPELDDGGIVSASHGAGLTFAALAEDGNLAVDVEPVDARSEDDWQHLLGEHFALAGLIGKENGEDADTTATRVWTAAECLRKAGIPAGSPLTLAETEDGPWAILASGTVRIATLVTALHGSDKPVTFAVLTDERKG